MKVDSKAQIIPLGNVDKDVYVYFNNDAYGYAVKNALKLIEFVK